MLVISRKVGERILLIPSTALAGQIAITVTRIGPDAVRLGIEAPDDIDIVREEIAGRLLATVLAEADDVCDVRGE